MASSTIAAPTSRAWSRTGSIVTFDSSAIASADVEDALDLLGATGDVGVERQGPVDLDDVDGDDLGLVRARPCSATSRTIRASLGPPLRARTARRKAGAVGVGHGLRGGSARAADERPSALGRTAVTIPPRSHPTVRGRRGPGRQCLAAIRDVGDDRVLATDERGLEPLGRLVVEQPVPPVAGDVLGQDDDRDRGLLVRRPGLVEHVEVGERPGEMSARYGDSTMTSGTPGIWRSQRSRSASPTSGSSVTNTARTSRLMVPPELDRLDDRAVDAVDRDDHPLLAMRSDPSRGRRGPASSRSWASYSRRMNSIIATRTGMSTMTSHAPSTNFTLVTTTATMAGRDAADGVDGQPAAPARVARAQPVPDHAAPG